MNSSRPYLLRAFYDWIVDNGCTPYVLLDAEDELVAVPQEYVRDGQIVLNIAPSAIRALHFDNESISFGGRFSGVAHEIYAPMSAVLAIYARENGRGMVFQTDTPLDDPPPGVPDPGDGPPARPKGPPSLKVVK